jgi:hypothetical protein
MGSRLIGCPKSTQTTGFTRLADALVREAYWDTDNTTLVMEFALTDSMVERASDAPSDAASGARSPARGPSCARVAAIGCSRNPADLMFDNSRAKWHSPRGRLRSANRPGLRGRAKEAPAPTSRYLGPPSGAIAA